MEDNLIFLLRAIKCGNYETSSPFSSLSIKTKLVLPVQAGFKNKENQQKDAEDHKWVNYSGLLVLYC